MRADLINAENIAEAVTKSRGSQLRRAIVPLMLDGKSLMGPNSKNQYFLNALQPGTEVDIHSHGEKLESFSLLQGKLKVILFSAEGEVKEIKILENKGDSSFVAKGRFHTVVALEADTVVYEFKEDKYDAATDKISAPWAPQENKLNDPKLREKRADFYGRWLVECKVGDRVESFKKLEQPKTPNTLTNEETILGDYNARDVLAKSADILRVESEKNLLAKDTEYGGIAPMPNDLIVTQPQSERADNYEAETSCLSSVAHFLSTFNFNFFFVNASKASTSAPLPPLTQKIEKNEGTVNNYIYYNCSFFDKNPQGQQGTGAQVEFVNGVHPELLGLLNH